ncbi:MAG: methylmalonyl-CoA mutase family protein [Polyangiales bacterium]
MINKEFGLSKNENPSQGSSIIERLTDMVEAAVLAGVSRDLTDRGGVLGAMERMYQRSKIQEESLHYETLSYQRRAAHRGGEHLSRPQGEPHGAAPRGDSRDRRREGLRHRRPRRLWASATPTARLRRWRPRRAAILSTAATCSAR